jgi:hypothetical protein
MLPGVTFSEKIRASSTGIFEAGNTRPGTRWKVAETARFKTGPETVAGTARSVRRTMVPDPVMNHAEIMALCRTDTLIDSPRAPQHGNPMLNEESLPTNGYQS